MHNMYMYVHDMCMLQHVHAHAYDFRVCSARHEARNEARNAARCAGWRPGGRRNVIGGQKGLRRRRAAPPRPRSARRSARRVGSSVGSRPVEQHPRGTATEAATRFGKVHATEAAQDRV